MCKVYVHIALLKCWGFPALGWHQKCSSHGADAYFNWDQFAFILFPTSVFVGQRVPAGTGTHPSEFLCGLWLQWFSACCSFTVSRACISSTCVETATFSSEFKDGFFFFIWKLMSVDWFGVFTYHSLCFFRNQNSAVLGYQSCLSWSALVTCVQLYFFWVQSGPSAADPAGSSFLGKKSIIFMNCSAGNLLHLIDTKLSLLCYLNLMAKAVLS